MLLEYLKLAGFRRFHEPTKVQLSGKLVAIVGSNEAGKTSILRAISSFGGDEPISPSDKTHLGTRDVELSLVFYLEKEDLEAAELKAGSWLEIFKESDGQRTYEITPDPDRDYSRREAVQKLASRFLSSVSARNSIAKEGIELDYAQIEKIPSLVSLRAGTYEDEGISELESSLEALEPLKDAKVPAYVSQLVTDLAELIQFERSHDPHQNAVNVLSNRVPPILFFGQEDRDINLPYSIVSYDEDETVSPPSKPLAEIIRLSGLDMNALVEAERSGNDAVRIGLLTAANEKLRSLSEGLWSQSDACLYITLNSGKLDLLVEHKEGFAAQDRYNNLRDRSDGYRQFVALQVFGFLRELSGSILLIDEIEQHLHYDAQADLVQLLQREQTVQKVVYTTHSAGALPEDLGSGVRLAQWGDGDKKYSTVNNKFWHRSEHEGFKPLLFGMGAATLAFFPTRKALIGEGVTELLLLPRLLREALGVASLGFQVIHGLSNISPKGLPMIDSASNGVVYIVDGDGSGVNITKGLVAAGVDKEMIFSLKKIGSSITIEDLIDRKIWQRAVRSLAEKYNPGLIDNLSAANFPANNRIKALPALIGSRKVEIAYEILDFVDRDPTLRIISSAKREPLKRLGEQVVSALGATPN